MNVTPAMDETPAIIQTTTSAAAEGDDFFSIEDFTTVSPFERIVKTVLRQLKAWNISLRWSSDAPLIKLASVLPFTELDKPHFLRLTATRMKRRRRGSPFYAKASKYQRWFGLDEFFALEVVTDPEGDRVGTLRHETANTLLNALRCALDGVPLHGVAAFVCRDGGLTDHHLGSWITDSFSDPQS